MAYSETVAQAANGVPLPLMIVAFVLAATFVAYSIYYFIEVHLPRKQALREQQQRNTVSSTYAQASTGRPAERVTPPRGSTTRAAGPVLPLYGRPDPAIESGFFISYRRSDDPGFAGRLGDRLAQHFGKSRIFMDVDSIELGVDFSDVINHHLAQCAALVAVIGKGWLNASDAQGRMRLTDTNDYVRLEIEAALRRNILVIPVIAEGARMPRVEELPGSIQRLARRNGIEISHASFGSDTAKLIATLERL
jgi:TIR domain